MKAHFCPQLGKRVSHLIHMNPHHDFTDFLMTFTIV